MTDLTIDRGRLFDQADAITDTARRENRQLTEAEEALGVQGYLHPSRASLLVDPVQRAVAERHDARGALADLLFLARTVLDDAA